MRSRVFPLMPVLLRALLPVLLGALAIVAGVAEAAGTVKAAELGSTGVVHELDGVLLASQPGAADLALARERGVRTVINLRTAAEPLGFDEPAQAQELGLQYVALRWLAPDEMSDELLDEARKLLRETPRPLLLHCGSGNRVGAVYLPWRVLDDGVSYEQALAEAKTIGLVTPEYEQKARDYIARRRAAP